MNIEFKLREIPKKVFRVTKVTIQEWRATQQVATLPQSNVNIPGLCIPLFQQLLPPPLNNSNGKISIVCFNLVFPESCLFIFFFRKEFTPDYALLYRCIFFTLIYYMELIDVPYLFYSKMGSLQYTSSMFLLNVFPLIYIIIFF